MKRAVIVGAGSMGRTWGHNLNRCPDVQVVGWVDLDVARAGDAAKEVGFEHLNIGGDLGKVLAETRPDFVVDVTVPEAHRDVTVQALEAGCPVLGEKPMALTMAHAKDMVAASEKTGLLYMVSQSRRYNPDMVTYRELVRQVGPLGVLNVDFYLGPHFGGFRDEMGSPLVADMAIHTFDQARFLSGSDAVSVYAEEYNPAWSWMKGDANATCLFEMEGGLRFTYRGSWVAEGCNTSWEGDWRAVGAKGSATWDGAQGFAGEVAEGDEGFMRPQRKLSPSSQPAGFKQAIEGSLAEFLAALDGGPTPQGECHDNIQSVAMVCAAIESARRRERVMVGEMLA
ncbi:MAG: Gfo/Idh/MocA family oxidoreductase [Fimbriimonadaceae bacterium]|nr:Gfo/Idh/MocA family oxidoreductase [Fimbriimonadaceae bacterium]